jgi:hypothetical protein
VGLGTVWTLWSREKVLTLDSDVEKKIFGLLFPSPDNFKIFKSHYINLMYFSTFINVIFVSQISRMKPNAYQAIHSFCSLS